MEGWIKLHRQILNHWIYKDPVYLHAWITILLDVNHAEKKVLIGSTLLTVNPGESLNSLETWAKKFGHSWTKQKVRTFFGLLKTDSMITTKNERKTTRLSVCKYNTYQTSQHADNTLITRKQHADNTLITPNKNDKNVNNEKNAKIYRSFDHLQITIEENQKLLDNGYSQIAIDETLDSIENFAGNKKYKSLYLTSLKWLKKDQAQQEEYTIIPGLSL